MTRDHALDPVPQDRSVGPGDRLDSPSFHRNCAPLVAALRPWLDGRTGDAVEIGSGSGQHAVAFAGAWPDLTWHPSDPSPTHCRSIEAWRRHAGLANLAPATALDVLQETWPPCEGADLAALLCLNVVHIAPWAASLALLHGAARYLRPDGVLVVYGPFKRDGRHNAASNVEFDALLRAQNPDWGVRDIADLEAAARAHGLGLREVRELPANNRVVVLTR